MRLLVLLFLFLLPTIGFGAVDGETSTDTTEYEAVLDSTGTDSTVAGDTVSVEEVPPTDTVLFHLGSQLTAYQPASDTINLEGRLVQNPTTALFKSMVLPGWGQYGNRKYLKTALCVGLEIWLVSSALRFGSEASDFYKSYEAATTVADRNSIYSLYMNRKDSRNKYTWFVFIVSFLSMFDAYVDAHLSGFPDKQRLGNVDFEVGPDFEGGIKAALTMPF